MKLRIPIRFVTVFGVTALVAVAVGLVFYLGFASATKNTRLLMTNQSEGLISSMEQDIALWLEPVQLQANWVADYVSSNEQDLLELENFDEFMLGSLAATSQVAGIAIIKTDGTIRRWSRSIAAATTEDWSTRADVMQWIASGETRTEPSWVEPFFTQTIDKTVLLHDMPIRSKDGSLLGMLAQIVPVEELSNHVANAAPRAGITPFILHGKNRVLAHPSLSQQSNDGTAYKPLMDLNRLDDTVLDRLWSPDTEDLFLFSEEGEFQTAGTFIEEHDRFYVYIYKSVENYGPVPWVIGAYLNTDLYGGDETQRLLRALVGSILVLLAALAGAIYLGRYITRPITAIAAATHLVDANKLDEIPLLPRSRMKELDDAAQSFNQMIVDLRQRTLIRQTLGQFVPEEVARTLLSEGGKLTSKTTVATVLCSDIEDFTGMTESLGANKTVDVLNAYFSAMVDIVERHDGVVTQFHGDALIATFNIPIDNSEHAKSAVLVASEMLGAIESQQFAGHSLRARIGIDTGTVVAGAVGAAGRLSYTAYGDSVNLAARLEQLNKKFGTRVLISENTVKLTEDAMQLRAMGRVSIRGQTAPVQTYSLESDTLSEQFIALNSQRQSKLALTLKTHKPSKP